MDWRGWRRRSMWGMGGGGRKGGCRNHWWLSVTKIRINCMTTGELKARIISCWLQLWTYLYNFAGVRGNFIVNFNIPFALEGNTFEEDVVMLSSGGDVILKVLSLMVLGHLKYKARVLPLIFTGVTLNIDWCCNHPLWGDWQSKNVYGKRIVWLCYTLLFQSRFIKENKQRRKRMVCRSPNDPVNVNVI